MLLYISGYNSTYNEYIEKNLKRFGNNIIYYVLKNDYVLDKICLKQIIEENTDVYIIAHSFGCFHSLNLFREYENIQALHCINAAFNPMNINNIDANKFVSDYKKYISNDLVLNEKFYKNKVLPIVLYQGILDDVVDIKYNYNFIKYIAGNINEIEGTNHRFDEDEFKKILELIRDYIMKPL